MLSFINFDAEDITINSCLKIDASVMRSTCIVFVSDEQSSIVDEDIWKFIGQISENLEFFTGKMSSL